MATVQAIAGGKRSRVAAPASARAQGAGWGRLLIIDRYLLWQFCQTYLICFISLNGLYVIIDGFGNLEEFINYGRDHGGVLVVMSEYYFYRSMSFFESTSPILTLIAAMFTVTWIQRHNELTALEAAGVPKVRVIKPVIVAAVLISCGLSVANREFAIPSARSHLSHNAQDLGGSSGKSLLPRYDHETDVLLGGVGSKTYANEKRIHRPDFYLPTGLDRYGAHLTADDAFYQPATDDHPSGYLMRGVERPAGLQRQPSLTLDGQAVLLTPADHAWLKPDECFVASNVTFEHLQGGSGWLMFSSTAELVQGLRNRSLDYGADERLAIHCRIVQPLSDMTLLFLGLPLVLSRSRRNVFLAIGLCMALVLVYMLVIIACKYLGSSYLLEPALAAWLPLMIFVPAAVALSGPLRQ